MMPTCPKCGNRGRVLKDICLTCQWHILKDRRATTDELVECQDEMDREIADLEVFLEKDITRDAL